MLLRCVALSGMTVDRSYGCVLLCGTLADNERAYDRKQMDHISEKAYVCSFQYDLLHKTDHDSRGYKNTRRHSRSEQRMGKAEMIAGWALGRKEG